jgi:hypothetical protein
MIVQLARFDAMLCLLPGRDTRIERQFRHQGPVEAAADIASGTCVR